MASGMNHHISSNRNEQIDPYTLLLLPKIIHSPPTNTNPCQLAIKEGLWPLWPFLTAKHQTSGCLAIQLSVVNLATNCKSPRDMGGQIAPSASKVKPCQAVLFAIFGARPMKSRLLVREDPLPEAKPLPCPSYAHIKGQPFGAVTKNLGEL